MTSYTTFNSYSNDFLQPIKELKVKVISLGGVSWTGSWFKVGHTLTATAKCAENCLQYLSAGCIYSCFCYNSRFHKGTFGEIALTHSEPLHYDFKTIAFNERWQIFVQFMSSFITICSPQYRVPVHSSVLPKLANNIMQPWGKDSQ